MRIDVRQVSFAPGLQTLLHGISFGLRTGECLGILGPSGAGKSTLLKTVNGFERELSEGQVLYGGQDLHAAWDGLKAQIGYVPQDDIVHPSLTARQELWYAGLLRLPPQEEEKVERRVEEVLGVLELREVADLRIHRLSGGQRKRVSIGVELMTSPPVLFLDEPTSGLDPALEEKMMRLFQSLARQGRSVLLTTHVMETLEVLDLVLVLVKGRLVFFGPPTEALGYFGVSRFAEIYPRLETRSPDDWRSAFQSHALHQHWVRKRLEEPQPEIAPSGLPGESSGALRKAPAETDPGTIEAPVERAAAVKQTTDEPEEESLDEELARLKREVRG